MMWAVITYLVLTGIGLVVAMFRHGDCYEFNFWSTLISTLVSLFLLYEGGFFNVFINN